MVISSENSLIDLLLKDARFMFNAFGFKIININFESDNFRLELERDSDKREDNANGRNLSPLIFITLNLVNKILHPFLCENNLTYNFINLYPEFSETKLSVEVDVTPKQAGILFLEAYCYHGQSFLVAKASSFLYLK